MDINIILISVFAVSIASYEFIAPSYLTFYMNINLQISSYFFN